MDEAVILLVDDEISILKSLRRTLFEYPYEIIVVPSPREAKETLAVKRVDMIISDYKMPDESGFELLSFVRDMYPEIIRIMLSGYVEKESILKSLFSCAALSFFPKPWDDTILLNRIRELIDIKQSVEDPDLWKLINSGKLFGISNYEISKLSKYKNEVKLTDELLKLFSDNAFVFFRVTRIVYADYFKTNSRFNLTEAINTIGLDNLFKLCEDIPVTNFYKTDVYSIMSDMFSLYYDDVYKELSNSSSTEPLNINLPFIYLYNYLLFQTNRKEYLSRIESFKKNGQKLNSKDMVNNLFKMVLKLCLLPEDFYEKCEKIESDETYSVLAAKKLRDIVELFWWSESMPEKHPVYTISKELLDKIYADIKRLQL